jgi:lysophospholipase L1-like esterase
MLATLDPDWVIILVGANDFWTEPVEIRLDAGTARAGDWLRRLRVYRLLYMARRAFDVPDAQVVSEETAPGRFEWTVSVGEEQFDLGHASRAPQDRARASRELARNLASAVDLVARHGARPVLLTYPSWSGSYGASNPIIRSAAERTGAVLLDLERVFIESCPDARCAPLLLDDHHPRAEGYVLVASRIADALESGLSR